MLQLRSIVLIPLFLLLQACATPESAPQATVIPAPDFGNASRFGARPLIPTPDEVHSLTQAQEAAFLTYFHHPSRANVSAHMRLYNYLENMVDDFSYQADTLTAVEALASNSGNCLSLAILTTALARLANVEIAYQLMDDQPVFEYQGNVVKRGVHISSLIYNPQWRAAAGTPAAESISPGIRIDYFPELRGRFLANLNSNEYLALYYSNIAADAIANGEYGPAYWYLLEALELAPAHGAALNMLAVINRRSGDVDTAEKIYQYGIAHAEDKLTLLRNYQTLLRAAGRDAEAAELQDQLDTIDDPSPLHWLQLARNSHAGGDLDAAIGFYQRVLQLAPYMHEVQIELAQTYYAAGNVRNAESALVDAVALANRVSTRNLYKAKLFALRKEF